MHHQNLKAELHKIWSIRLIISLLILIKSLVSFGQDTIYFDNDNKVTSKVNSQRFRVISQSGLVYSIKDYSTDGHLQMETMSKEKENPEFDGQVRYYYPDGTISTEGFFNKGIQFGTWRAYAENGKLKEEVNYNEKGNLHGYVKTYYPDRQLRRSDVYDNSKKITGRCFTSSGADTVWFPFEEYPMFPGGDKKRVDFVMSHIRYPSDARAKDIKGTVYVSFIVDTTGKLEDIRILKGLFESLDKEAIRVVSEMPAWNPGKHDGIPVRVRFHMPVAFFQ